MREYISNQLRNARENANLRQVDVMNRTGIPNKNLSNWEKGVALPYIEDLIILADLYGVSLDELVGHKTKEAAYHLGFFQKKILDDFSKLNDEGKGKLVSYLDDLLKIDSYTKKDSTLSA